MQAQFDSTFNMKSKTSANLLRALHAGGVIRGDIECQNVLLFKTLEGGSSKNNWQAKITESGGLALFASLGSVCSDEESNLKELSSFCEYPNGKFSFDNLISGEVLSSGLAKHREVLQSILSTKDKNGITPLLNNSG
ncbi:hypothetical protein MMC31_004405 [Peltigera leucophlebia]|nr:hypothetical protein [Peltigera leucophlebia]